MQNYKVFGDGKVSSSDAAHVEADYFEEQGTMTIFYRRSAQDTVQVAAFPTRSIYRIEIVEAK